MKKRAKEEWKTGFLIGLIIDIAIILIIFL